MLTLPGALEPLYWSHPDTVERTVRVDLLGAVLGTMMHTMIVFNKINWSVPIRAWSGLGAVMQLMQVSD